MAVPKVVRNSLWAVENKLPHSDPLLIVLPTSAGFPLRSSAQCVGISSSTVGNFRTNPSPPESPFHLFILLLERRSRGCVHLSNEKRNQLLPHGQTVGLTEGRPVPLSTLPQSCATETCGEHLYPLCGNKPHELIFILGYQSKLQRIRTVSNNYTNSFSKGVDDHPRSEFKKNAQLDKKDFGTIEYMLRRGHRQLEIYADPGIRNILR